MVSIQLLGEVRVSVRGVTVPVGSARSQIVLAALALSPRRPVPVPRLIELVWGGNPPDAAAKALQWHVVRLRKGLGAEAVVRTGSAYRLDVDPGLRCDAADHAGDEGAVAGVLVNLGGDDLLEVVAAREDVVGLQPWRLGAPDGVLPQAAVDDRHADLLLVGDLPVV